MNQVHLRRVILPQLLAQQPGCWLRTSVPLSFGGQVLWGFSAAEYPRVPSLRGFPEPGCSVPTPLQPPFHPPLAGAVVADCVHGESLWNRFGAASSIPSRSSSCVLPYNFRIIIASVHVNITSQFPLILPPAIFPHTNLM